MKRENCPVGSEGIRPLGPPDRCFYCNATLGEQHGETCVIRNRTVLVRATVEYVVSVPEHWDAEAIEFQRNDGSWCADNLIAELQSIVASERCLCPLTRFEFVREASIGDEAESGLFVSKLPS